MTAADAFKQWRPDTLVPTHQESYEAGWKACMDFMEGRTWGNRTAMALSDGRKIIAAEISQPTAEDIYNAYPRKVGKQGAIKAIEKIVRFGARSQKGYDFLLQRTQAYAAAVAKWPRESRFTRDGIDTVPHPATWFNRGSYDDDPSEWQRGASTQQQIKSRN